jgi:hypothetical protein
MSVKTADVRNMTTGKAPAKEVATLNSPEARLVTPTQADVTLRLVYIDDEVMWPEPSADGDSLRVGWVKAVADTGHILLLDVSRIKKIYGYGGRLYVLYEAEVAERYSIYVAQPPSLVVELDYDVYYEHLYDSGCTCKMWRFSIDASRERERFIKKVFGADAEPDAELKCVLAKDAQPVNFSIVPVNISLYATEIAGIAVVENPRFRLHGGEDTYEGKYVVLLDGLGFYFLYLCCEVDAEKLENLWKITSNVET